jgi:hypothetical protein
VIKIASIIGTQFSTLLLHDILPSKGLFSFSCFHFFINIIPFNLTYLFDFVFLIEFLGELTSARQKVNAISQSDSESQSTSSTASSANLLIGGTSATGKKISELRGLGGRLKDHSLYSHDGLGGRPKFNISSPNLKNPAASDPLLGTHNNTISMDAGSALLSKGQDRETSSNTANSKRDDSRGNSTNRRPRPSSSNSTNAPLGELASLAPNPTVANNSNSSHFSENSSNATASSYDSTGSDEMDEKLNAMKAKRDNKVWFLHSCAFFVSLSLFFLSFFLSFSFFFSFFLSLFLSLFFFVSFSFFLFLFTFTLC